jgi:NADH-quinone oxidoreductase subunit G
MTDKEKTAEAPKNPDEVLFTIDGETVTGKKGQTVLEAGLDNGMFIPHYCWHPALSIAGNCRMCLVNMKGAPKPVIACQTECREGMEIDAFSESANKTREGVMELLLINHPLDCPVCDQAGECDLQEYSFKHGSGESRFLEAKNQKPNKDLGEMVRFNGNRCILCSRCVRFCDEITGTHELTIRERGEHNYIDTFPGYPLDNPLSACTTDLCPVGALLDRDFVHKARVWNLTPTKSVCAGCSTGCNINAESWNDSVQRLTPRENQAVNKFWMCDEGRLLYHQSNDKDNRVLEYSELGKAGERIEIGGDRAMELLGENWKGAFKVHGSSGVGVIVTGWNTNEEIYQVLSLLKGDKNPTLGAEDLPIACVYSPPGIEWEAKDGFKISKDKNPNREGIRRILGDDYADANLHHGLDRIEKLIEEKKLQLLVVIDALPGKQFRLPESFMEKVKGLAYVAAFEGVQDGLLGELAHLRLPAATWLEKDGSFVNDSSRVQRVRPAVPPAGALRWDLDVLQDVARRVEVAERTVSSAALFKRMAKAEGSAFNGMTYNDLGEYGAKLEDAGDENLTTGYGAGPVSRVRYADQSVAEMIRVSVHRGG